MEQRENGLAVLMEIARDLTASLAADDRYARLLDAVTRMIPCDAACLLRLEGDDLVPVAGRGLAPEALVRRFNRREHPRLDIILSSAEPVLFPHDSRLPDPFDHLLSMDHEATLSVHACLGCRLTEGAHVVEMNLALARAAGAAADVVRFPLAARPEDEAYIEEQLGKQQLREFFILSPGGGWGSKCWPVERYAALHNALARERGWRTVLNAGPGEERLVSEFEAQARVTKPVHLTLTLRQLAALLKRAKALVSGDTGPLHLAAALGTPVVGLYGPTDPVRNGPYGRRAVVLHHRELATLTYKHEEKTSPALQAITVEEVVGAVNQVLEAGGGK